MKIEKGTAVSRTTDEVKTNIIASVEFAVRASLREEYADSGAIRFDPHELADWLRKAQPVPYRLEEANPLRRSA
jgi:hypothetical protein